MALVRLWTAINDPDSVFSAIDCMRLYSYAHQPQIDQLNLIRFAELFFPVIDKHNKKVAKILIDYFPALYHKK